MQQNLNAPNNKTEPLPPEDIADVIMSDSPDKVSKELSEIASPRARGFGLGLITPFFFFSGHRQNERDYDEHPYDIAELIANFQTWGYSSSIIGLPTGAVIAATTGHLEKYVLAVIVTVGATNLIDYAYNAFIRSREQQTSHQNH